MAKRLFSSSSSSPIISEAMFSRCMQESEEQGKRKTLVRILRWLCLISNKKIA